MLLQWIVRNLIYSVLEKDSKNFNTKFIVFLNYWTRKISTAIKMYKETYFTLFLQYKYNFI